jgi:hypothetical protein
MARAVPPIVLAGVLVGLLAALPGSAAADDVLEPNDSFAQAVELGFGAHALTAADDDWFVVRDVPPGILRFEVPAAGTTVHAFLWSATAANPNGVCSPQNGCLAAGPMPDGFPLVATTTLYVQVKPIGAGGPYTLTLGTSVDHPGDDAGDGGAGDDSIASATPLPSATFDLANRVSNDPDFFAIPALPGQLSICLEFDPGDGNVDLELYDASLTRVALGSALTNEGCTYGAPATGPANKRRIERGLVAAGTLYVATRGSQGVPYRLTIDLPTQWIARLPYGPIRHSSIALADLDGDGFEEILVGTSKGLDASMNEIVPAALVCLEHDGSVRWAFSPPAMPGPDPSTGRTYQTSSVGSSPAVGDLDGDGDLDVVFGAGADIAGEGPSLLRPGQPGDMGGVYAVDGSTGALLWAHQTLDRIGTAIGGDGIPDGVFGTPVIGDLDGEPGVEVIVGGWDQAVWVLDGATGESKTGPMGPHGRTGTLVYDTVWSSPTLADLTGDGRPEILIGGDQTTNPEAGTQTGGVFHAIDRFGHENVPGFDDPTNVNPTNPGADPLPGKWEEQTVWSSPAAADFDGDGRPEIAYGTSFFGGVPSTKGRYIRVWNHDGSPFQLFTTGAQTFASPLFADLTGDGSLELIAADMAGRLYAWSATSGSATPLWATTTVPWAPSPPPHPIIGSPIAADLNGDDQLEILYAQGPQIVVVDAHGNQISDPTRMRMTVGGFLGSPAVGDVNRDQVLDIVAGGAIVGAPPCNCPDDKKGVVFSFRWDGTRLPADSEFRFAKRQFRTIPEPAWGGAAAALTLLAVARGRARRPRA